MLFRTKDGAFAKARRAGPLSPIGPVWPLRAALAAAAALAVAAALTCASFSPLRAQNAPASPDAALDSQKAAFDALPEADRRAIQDGLAWSGEYVGVVDGVFGKRTRDSILAWQASVKAPANGIVDAAELAALTGAAQKARAALRFQTFVDDKSGVRIGAPLKLLDKRISEASGARLAKADGSVTLDLMSLSGADASLGKVYARLTAEAPARKITMKVSRPDFIAVASEEGGRKIFERMAKVPAGWSDPTMLRGFRFAYPAAQARDLDRVGVAIANSFEPFPSPGAPPAAPPPPPPKPTLAASGFIIAPGQAVSAIAAADCAEATIGGKPARFIREDRELGLSLIAGDFGAGARAAPRFGALGPDMVALSYAPAEPDGRVAIEVAAASPLPPGAAGRPRLLASLPRAATGAPVFGRSGALAAIIAPASNETKLVAGVAPVAAHPVVEAAGVRRFLALTGEAAPEEGATLGAGRIAAAERANVVAIYCRR